MHIGHAKFRDLLAMVQTELDRLTPAIHAQAGQEFNIRSSQQLADILFQAGLGQQAENAKGRAVHVQFRARWAGCPNTKS